MIKTEKSVNKNILGNMIYAIIIMTYFLFLIIGLKIVDKIILEKYIKISSMILLLISICIFEKSYKTENTSTAINGIEFLAFAIHLILLTYLANVFNTTLNIYVAVSAYTITIYYVIKSMIIYTKFRKQQLDSLSDIAEIVKEEPTKKEPTKRPNKEEDKPEEAKTKNKKDKEENKTEEKETKKENVKKAKNKKDKKESKTEEKETKKENVKKAKNKKDKKESKTEEKETEKESAKKTKSKKK